MLNLTLLRIAALTTLLGVGGCALVSDDQSTEDLKTHAEKRASFQVPAPPGSACAKTARMLMWCAGGPNYHYRCNSASDGSRAELSATLEAIYRTEYLMVAEFVRTGGDSTVTVHQHDSVLIYDYAPMIESSFTNATTCQPR